MLQLRPFSQLAPKQRFLLLLLVCTFLILLLLLLELLVLVIAQSRVLDKSHAYRAYSR